MIFVAENEADTLSAGHYSDATIEADTLRGARYGKNVHISATNATTAEDLTQAFAKLHAADIERCYITGWKDGLVTAAIVEPDQITSADYEHKQEGVGQKVVLVIEDTESSFDIAYPGVVGGTDTVTAFETAIRNAESKRNSCTLYYEDVLLDDEIKSPRSEGNRSRRRRCMVAHVRRELHGSPRWSDCSDQDLCLPVLGERGGCHEVSVRDVLPLLRRPNPTGRTSRRIRCHLPRRRSLAPSRGVLLDVLPALTDGDSPLH